MQMKSIWLENYDKQTCPSLNEDLKVDVLIIGGGLTGISAAYHLINSHLKVAVVEKNIIGNGVTSRSTAKLTYLQDHISTVNKVNGLKKTKQYIDSQIEAIELVKEIVNKHQIDCHLQKAPHYLYVHEDTNKFNDHYNVYKALGYPIKVESLFPDGMHFKNGFCVLESYVFHPLKYVSALKELCLANQIAIYEKTTVYDIQNVQDGYICKTNHHKIEAKKIVLALHYPYFTIPFFMPLKTHLQKSYIVACDGVKNDGFSSLSLDEPIVSTRFFENYRLHLSGTHPTYYEINDHKHFEDLFQKVENIKYAWSNKDNMTYDGLPFIGHLDKKKSMFIATGYNTWGMTNASLAGKMISDMILNKISNYALLFDPKRHVNLEMIKNSLSSVVGYMNAYIQAPLKKQPALYYENRNGKKVAVYVDENKNEHIVYPTCPHLKCSLLFNEIEKTWDCPCHGSRFDIDGHVIEGPSQYDISYLQSKEA